MRKAAAYISRNSGIRKGLSATAVGRQTIIGSKTNGVTNVSPVKQDYPCAVAPSWKIPSYPL